MLTSDIILTCPAYDYIFGKIEHPFDADLAGSLWLKALRKAGLLPIGAIS